MKRKILCLLLAALMLLSTAFVLTACGDQGGDGGDGEHTCVDLDRDGYCDICKKKMESDKHKCVDKNGDGKCDVCGKTMENEGPVSPYDWDTTELIYKMTKSSNGQALPAGCERYMAGEDSAATETVDDMIRERNANAYSYANVSIYYEYNPDTTGYSWADSIEPIYTEVMSKAADKPDIYTNFLTDMVCTSLKGSFANMMSTSRGTGSLKGENYFQFLDKNYDEEVNNLGYMYEFSKTLTLSKFKMYVLGSDYFTDLIRCFAVMPINVKLMNSVAEEALGDINGDGISNIDDFYDMVRNRQWTYARLAEFCELIYQPGAENSGSTEFGDEVIGFAVPHSAGVTTNFLYTTSVIIVHRDWDDAKEDYTYYYTETNPDLEEFCAELKKLFETTGVMSFAAKEVIEYGANSNAALRNRFAQDHLLFGGSIPVGSLEYDEYQEMKNGTTASQEDIDNQNYGFGVAPMPMYHAKENERYLTLIGPMGKGGGISATTTKFAQCTAFLDYQSTHSTDILNEYYDYKLQYDVAGGTPGNVYILQYIRSNVRSSFDKVFEDAIGLFFRAGDPDAFGERWTNLLDTYRYKMTNIAEKYAALYPKKAEYLSTLEAEYDKLPD